MIARDLWSRDATAGMERRQLGMKIDQTRKVAEKELGLKSGKGFYAYGPDDAARISALANSAVMNAIKEL